MDFKKIRVLVVEDSEVMSTYVVNLLKRLSIEYIELSKDGEEALKIIPEFRPNLIISDIHMKPLNGIEFVERLRESKTERMKRIPVIFMSADSTSSTLAKAMTLGAVAYVVKPPRLEVLKTKIEHAAIFL